MCLHICFVPELLKSVTTYCYFLIHFTFRVDCFFRCTVKFSRQSPMCSERIAANVSGAWRRAGFHKGSDGRRTPKILRSVPRDSAPPDAKPLVSSSFFYFAFISHGVNVNEISTEEIPVTAKFPYCLNSKPLKSLIAIILSVIPAKSTQYFTVAFPITLLSFGNL